jgi:TusA-related sulfurtransferase
MGVAVSIGQELREMMVGNSLSAVDRTETVANIPSFISSLQRLTAYQVGLGTKYFRIAG